MRRYALGLSVVSFLLAAAATAREPVEAPKDELHGTWVVEEVRFDGQEHKDMRGARFTFSGGNFIYDDGRLVIRSTYSLDLSKTPRAIDFIRPGQAEPQEWGVYRVDAATLTMSTVSSVRKDESRRPTDISAAKGTDASFARLRRLR